VIYLFFCALIFEAKDATLRDLCQDVGMWCNFIMQIRGGPVCILYILTGKNLQILPHSWAMVATVNSYNLKTRLQIEKLKQMRSTTSLSNHNHQASYMSAL